MSPPQYQTIFFIIPISGLLHHIDSYYIRHISPLQLLFLTELEEQKIFEKFTTIKDKIIDSSDVNILLITEQMLESFKKNPTILMTGTVTNQKPYF